MLRPFAVCLASFLLSVSLASGQTDADVRTQLDLLRGISAPASKADTAAINDRMDSVWRFVERNKPVALPVVRTELQAAVKAAQADSFFLLDVGYLLLTQDPDYGVPLAMSALERIDPKSPVIRANWEELFHFVMRLGGTGGESDRYLAQVDRIYLPNESGLEFFRPPHVVKLSADDLAVFVYGVAGPVAAPHLCAFAAKDSPFRERALRLLPMVGSETDVPAVADILKTARDFPITSAAITFLMQVGGPAGRAAVLAYQPGAADRKTQEYLERILPRVRAVTLDSLANSLKQVADPESMNDRKVQQALDAMELHNGADNDTPPISVLRSGIPSDRLLAQLKRIRARSFRREDNHMFADLEVTNLLINALQFRQALER